MRRARVSPVQDRPPAQRRLDPNLEARLSVAPSDGVAPGDGLGRQDALVFGMHGGLLRLRTAVEGSLTRIARTANQRTPHSGVRPRWRAPRADYPPRVAYIARSRSTSRSVASGRP